MRGATQPSRRGHAGLTDEAAGRKALDDFMATWNGRDKMAWAGTLNYPHVRVASGKVASGDIRDFAGTLAREKAELGVFITLRKPTNPARAEAEAAGAYASPWDGESYPKVQILTIEQLLSDPQHRGAAHPLIPGGRTNRKLPARPAQKRTGGRQNPLFDS